MASGQVLSPPGKDRDRGSKGVGIPKAREGDAAVAVGADAAPVAQLTADACRAAVGNDEIRNSKSESSPKPE